MSLKWKRYTLMKASNLSRAAGTTTNAVDIHVARPRIVQAGNFVLSTINVCDCFYFDAREIFFLEPKGEGFACSSFII
jgi:hypothetical protein